MPLPFFKRSKTEAGPPDAGAPSPGDEGAAVQAARVRARRRLIGAVVLLAAGVIGFPVLFETQPRPLPVDLPIQVASTGSSGAVTGTSAAAGPSRPAVKPVLEPPADAGNETPPAPAGAAASATAAPAPASATGRPTDEPARSPARTEPSKQPAETVVAKAEAGKAAAAPAPRASAAEPAPKPAAKPVAGPAPGDSARPAPAADKPKPSASAPATRADASASAPKVGRYVVQVGAFTDAAALRDARQRVEKLGFKSYTQVVETPAGARTRVRVGPFDTREEAERAGARLKSGGLPANLLTL